MNRAVIYARYSSSGQTEQSIEGQLRDCYKLAEEQGLTVVKEYIDRAKSGKNDNRPQFRKMISDSSYGIYDIVITWKMDRFARNRTDSALYKKILKENNVKVIYAAENIPEGNEGVILESVLEGLAEYYSLDLAQKLTRGRRESVRKGKHVGGKPLYGYKITPDKYYEIDENAAPIVKEIFKDYISGMSAVKIADKLNSTGVTTKFNEPWTRTKIAQLLRNRKYTGHYEMYGVQSEEPIPAIVDLATYEAAQNILTLNRFKGGQNKAKSKYLLSGKIKCGICGETLCGNYAYVNKRTKKIRYYYTCNGKKEKKGCPTKSIHRDNIEKLVIDSTMGLILQDDFIEKIASQIIKLNLIEEDTTSLLTAYEAELTDVKSRINNIMKAIEDGLASKKMTERLSELETREELLEAQIIEEKSKEKQTSITKEQIIYWLSMFKEGDINSPEFVEKLMKLFINKVIVNLNTIEIHYNYIDEENANSSILVNFSDNALDTGSHVSLSLSLFKTIYIGKNKLYLEIKLS